VQNEKGKLILVLDRVLGGRQGRGIIGENNAQTAKKQENGRAWSVGILLVLKIGGDLKDQRKKRKKEPGGGGDN